MEYEWDEVKRLANLARHGVDFAAVVGFRWETATEVRDERRDYGESRWISLGWIGAELHLLIYTRRAGRIRVISLRRANRKEWAHYDQTANS